MKTPLKLNVAFFHFPYAGNGACSAESPDVREWEVETALKIHKDERVGAFYIKSISDTPISMSRNKAIRQAKELGCHLMLMIDSDQAPSKHAHEPWFKPFWDEAFNFIYNNYQAGPRLVMAPYCGPPNGHENVYVFKATGLHNHAQETAWKLDAYTRDEAAMLTGIQEAAAGPTGMILIDMRLFDLIEPVAMSKEAIVDALLAGQMDKHDALYALRDGYCYYEWENQYCDKKASTEDVTLTRDIALAGLAKLGYNPVFCAWDSWIGHHKPWCVGKPQRYTIQDVNASYRKAVLEGVDRNEQLIDVGTLLNQGNDPLSRRIREMAKSVEAAFAANSNGHKQNGNGHVDVPERTVDPKNHNRTTYGPWYSHGGAPPEQLVLLRDAVIAHSYKLNRPLRILEVGSWLGGTAMAMADCLKGSSVHCVDTWAGTPSDLTGKCAAEAGGPDAVYAEFLKRIGDRLNKTIFPWRMSSAAAADRYWEPFDIIFLDADHSYEAVQQNIVEWWPHLRDDGLMLGHDYETSNCMGVTKAVDELFGDKLETFGWDPQGGMWKVRKADFPNGVACHEEVAR